MPETVLRSSPRSRIATVLVALAAALALLLNPTASPSAEAAVPAGVSAKALGVAAQQKGIRYRYGGTSPRTGFDCSGLTGYAYRKAGKKLPRTAKAQYARSKKIRRASARPGDLVFFYRGGRIYHVGIYAGGGKMWHSPRPGKRVSKVKIWTNRVHFGRVR
ncbi:MAG TPA: C40 family peptidase [Dermatophilaceae bacterium]|nr:C40 family peptidase [Dermatophilaceae bacterium]